MSKIKKTKNQVIVVPTTQTQSETKTKLAGKEVSGTKNPTAYKANTLAYFNCLIDQVQNPLNEKVKITQLSHHCRCNKGKEAVAREEHKQQLVQKVAQNYLAFGKSLGHYLQADLLGCLKKKKVLKK